MSLARGSMNLEDLKRAAYQRTNSAIFAPFMIHVLCALIGDIDIDAHIDKWAGGLPLLRRCYPEWDNRIKHAMQLTPMNHSIWKKFMEYHGIAYHSAQSVKSLCYQLLNEWKKSGKKNRCFGPYPSNIEQQEYCDACVEPMQHISNAIVDLQLEPCFEANNVGIHQFIQEQLQQQSNEQNNKNTQRTPPRMSENSQRQSQQAKQAPLQTVHDPFDYTQSTSHSYQQLLDANDRSKCGVLYYQCAYYTPEQIKHIYNAFKHNASQPAPKLLFGDNNVDKQRSSNESRMFYANQSEHLGKFDRNIGYGITTTFKSKVSNNGYFQGYSNVPTSRPSLSEYKRLLDKEFDPLIAHLLSGGDIICPSPTSTDISQRRSVYLNEWEQPRFRHNLGTGIANLPLEYLLYIQQKLDALAKYAKRVVYDLQKPKMYDVGWDRGSHAPQILTPTKRRKTPSPVISTSAAAQDNRTWIDRLPYEQSNGIRDRKKAKLLSPSNRAPNQSLMNQSINRTAEVQRQLIFDDRTQLANQSNDRFRSLHYLSPTMAGQQRRQQRPVYDQRTHAPQPGSGVHTLAHVSQQHMQSNDRRPYFPPQQQLSTLPHYKSPTGVVRVDEWEQYSTPPNSRKAATYTRYGNCSKPSMRDYNYSLNEHDWMWWLYLLLYSVRTMFESLTQHYRPQSVMRTLCAIFFIFAITAWIWNGNVTPGCFVCFLVSIVCAIVGADAFYPTPSVAEYTVGEYEYDRDNNMLNVPQATTVNARFQHTNISPWRH